MQNSGYAAASDKKKDPVVNSLTSRTAQKHRELLQSASTSVKNNTEGCVKSTCLP